MDAPEFFPLFGLAVFQVLKQKVGIDGILSIVVGIASFDVSAIG
ncbi:MAG: hypothetical protein ACOCTM_03975 [Bacteroidota bacterium]